MFLFNRVENEIGDSKWDEVGERLAHPKRRAEKSTLSSGYRRGLFCRFIVTKYLQSVFGTPVVKNPAKALCSKGDRWYFVVPLMVTPSWPKLFPMLTSEVLILFFNTLK